MRIRTAIPAAVAAAALTALAVLPAQAATAASNSPAAKLASRAHATATGPTHLFANPKAAPLRHSFATAQDATAAPAFTAVTADHTATGLVLKAVLDAANPAATVTADFYVGTNPATDKDGTTVLPTYNLTWNDTDGAWELPLDLPVYNTYNVVLHATNPIGTTPYDLNDVQFVLQPQLDAATASIGPAVIDYAHQAVTATGKVSLWDPRTGQAQTPGTNYTVVFLNGPAGSNIGTLAQVQSDGTFTVSAGVSATFAGGLFQVYAQTGNATSNSVSQNVNASTVSATRIVLDHTSVSGATAGRSYTVSGTVQYQTSTGAWAPVAGVYLDYQTPGSTYWSYYWYPTDANGRFSISTTVPSAAGTFKVHPSSVYPWSQFLKAAPATGVSFSSLHQVVTLRMSSQSIDEYSELSFYQSVTSTNNHVAYNKVYLLVSPNGKTGWTNLGYISVKDAYTGSGQITAWVANPHGWYKLYMPAGPGYSTTYSNTVHTFRYETRVTGGKPNHTTISKNHYLSFSGYVQRRGYGSWQSISGTRTYLLFRPTGSKQWTVVGTARTDRHGHYSVSAKAKRSGTWVVVWVTSNQAYVDSNGPMTWVRVK